MRTFQYCIIVCFLVFGGSLFGQTEAMEMPIKLNEPGSDKDIAKLLEYESSGEPWFVYSVYENNITTKSPGGDELLSSCGFMECFYVTDVEKSFIHIVKDDALQPDYKFSEMAIDYGWIHVDKLLLSNRPLVDENHRFMKVLPLLNANHYEELNDLSGDQQKNGLLYIYKLIDGKALVMDEYRIAYNKPSLTAEIQWVKVDSYIPWNGNLGVGPVPASDSEDERKELTILNSVNAAKTFINGKGNDPKDIVFEGGINKDLPLQGYLPVIDMDATVSEVAMYGELVKVVKGYAPMGSDQGIARGYVNGYFPVGRENNILKQSNFYLLYTAIEFSIIIAHLNELSEARTADNTRKAFYDTWSEILRGYLKDAEQSEIDKLSFNKMNEIVFGWPSNAVFLEDYTLIDILDVEKISDKILSQYTSEIAKRNAKLQNILNAPDYQASFVLGNTKYYWVHVDYIP